MTTVILVRHGESVANGKGFFAGQLDIPLSKNTPIILKNWVGFLFRGDIG